MFTAQDNRNQRWPVAMCITVLGMLHVAALRGEVLLFEDFSDGVLPSGFTVLNGNVDVADPGNGSGVAMYMFSGACVELPGIFDRSAHLVLEADVRITNSFVGDFNVNALYGELIDVDAGDCRPFNGYRSGVYPAGSDNPNALLSSTTNGSAVLLDAQPTLPAGGEWFHYTFEFAASGEMRVLVDGQEQLFAENVDHMTGGLSFRSWSTVWVDNIRVSTVGGCGSLPPANNLLVNDTFDTDILGWDFGSDSSSGGKFFWSGLDRCVDSSSGSIHAEVRFVNSEVWLEQCVSVTPSALYQLSAGVLAPKSQQSGGVVRILALWYPSLDCSDSPQSTTTFVTLQQNDAWVTTETGDISPPPGAGSASIRFLVDEQLAAQQPFFAQFDDLSFYPANDVEAPIMLFDDFLYDCIEDCPGMRALFGENAWEGTAGKFWQQFWSSDGASGDRATVESTGDGILALSLPQEFDDSGAKNPGAGSELTPRVASPVKFNVGTYAARIAFDGGTLDDSVVQTFFLTSSKSCDPLYAEADFEFYSRDQRLYYVLWETPCSPSASDSEPFMIGGWVDLVMRVEPGEYVTFELYGSTSGVKVADGWSLVAPSHLPEVGSRMGIFFNIWLVKGATPITREHELLVDWVMHFQDPNVSWPAISSQLATLRTAGLERLDTTPVFVDGFESGNLRYWASVRTGSPLE